MNITLPEEITQAMTRGVARGVEQARYLDNVGPMDRLQRGAAAEAMVEAARNPGGEAGSMMGAGLGMALGQQMGTMMAGQRCSRAARIPATAARAAPASSGAAVPRRAQRSGGRAVHRRSAAPVRGQRAAHPGLPGVDAGMPNWVAAHTVPALASLFAPPPQHRRRCRRAGAPA